MQQLKRRKRIVGLYWKLARFKSFVFIFKKKKELDRTNVRKKKREEEKVITQRVDPF
jgi:hypothetical protein